MSARNPGAGQTPEQVPDSFTLLEGVLNQRLEDAVAENAEEGPHSYFLIDRQPSLAYPLAVYCVVNSIEPFASRRREELQISVPIATPDWEMPLSVLGTEEHVFFLRYMAKRGGEKLLRVSPVVHARRFEGRGPAPVDDLVQKLLTYPLAPMRERPQDDA